MNKSYYLYIITSLIYLSYLKEINTFLMSVELAKNLGNAFLLLNIIITSICLLSLYLLYKSYYWKRKGVYHEKPDIFYGNIKDVFTGKCTENQLYNDIYKNMKNEKIAGTYYFWKPSLLIKDLAILKKIMITDFDYFVNHTSISDHRSTDKCVWSLFTMEGKLWKNRRQIFSSAFTPKKIKEYFKGIEQQLEQIMPLYEQKIKNSEEIELGEFTEKYQMNVITKILFGIHTDSVENPESKFVECGKYATDPATSTIYKIVLRVLMPKLYELLRLQTMPTGLWNCFYPFVKEIVQHRERNSILHDDILGLMLRQKNNHSLEPEMTLEEMTGHVYAFFEAGYDSTSLTTSYCLYELSQNMHVQDILRNEIDQLLNGRTRNITYEAITDMQYMDKVVKETLRKYPPSGLIRRECTKDYQIDNLKIKKGTQILIPVEAIHYDPEYYEEPDIFNPDRSYDYPMTYLPFGAGPRICIGMKVAELTVKVGIFKILSKYILKPSLQHPEKIEYDPKTIFISNRPKNGIWIRLVPRHVN